MDQTLKNTLLLGCALLFMVVFWVFFEISKSNALIELAKDPDASIKRGINEANADFSSGHAHFRKIFIDGKGRVYPGVLEKEIEGKYKEYAWGYLWCGTRLHLENIALNINQYKQNEHHAMAYNMELIKLIHRAKNI